MRLAAALACAGGVAMAEPPTTLEVLDTLVREAPGLTGEGSIWTDAPDESAVRFVTMMLFELGVYLPESEDSGSISVWCDPEGEAWRCWVSFGINWSDAESAYVGSMVLEPVEEGCTELTIDLHDPYRAGCWTVRDGVLTMELFG